MLHTTQGIVLHYFKYSENSIITKIYTQKFGTQSYIIKGLGSKKNKNQKAYLQPLSLVEINVYHKEKKTLQSLKTIKPNPLFQSIPFNIYKSAIAFFIAECLSKLIKEEEENHELFEFIYHSIEYFDLSSEYHNFHLIFLLQLTKYLGIYPQGLLNNDKVFFDLQEGSFKTLKPKHNHYSSVENTHLIKQFLKYNFKEEEALNITNSTRKKILSEIIEYFSIHLCNLQNLKSNSVLAELFS